MASLGALRTLLLGLRPTIGGSQQQLVQLYTFGQPRVGNAAFAQRHGQLLGERSFRVVNHLDLVVHMPACAKVNDDNEQMVAGDKEGAREVEDSSRPCDPSHPSGPYHHGVEIWYWRGLGWNFRDRQIGKKNRDLDFRMKKSGVARISICRIQRIFF
jgi:hypothetical protein